MTGLSLHDAIYTTRAMRRLKPDPVPEEDLFAIVEAGTKAPCGGNIQNWGFVIVTDAEIRRRLGTIYRELGEEWFRDKVLADPNLEPERRQVYENAMYLVEHMSEAPAIILTCMRGKLPSTPETSAAYYGSIFPAVQNIILAARERGLGTTLTTLHTFRQQDVREAVGLPNNVNAICLIPVGYPQRQWSEPKREPAAAVIHWNRWGNQRGTPAGGA